MSVASETTVAAERPPRRWAVLLLLVAALIEFLEGLSNLPILAGDLSEIPGPGFGGALITATIILHPLAAGAALYFIIRGKSTWALVSMAVVILLAWLSYLPSVQLHGLDFDADGTSGLLTFLVMILPPVLVIAISGLALTGRALTLATLLAVVPTTVRILSVIAFAIGVALYGF
jgi:hypothetical protein